MDRMLDRDFGSPEDELLIPGKPPADREDATYLEMAESGASEEDDFDDFDEEDFDDDFDDDFEEELDEDDLKLDDNEFGDVDLEEELDEEELVDDFDEEVDPAADDDALVDDEEELDLDED